MPLSARLLLCAAACPLLSAGPVAAKDRPVRSLTLDPDARVVELFEALDEGVLAARVSPRNEFRSSVFLTNASDAPVTVALPEAVTAVHVLKQNPAGFDGLSPFGADAQTAQGTLGRAQPVGGTFGAAGSNAFPGAPPGSGNGPAGAAFFSIPPERTVQVELHTVCLAHGRPTPHSRLKYVLRPLEEQVTDPALRELLSAYDPETTHRMALQAAAWHLADGMSWEQLASKHVPRRGLLLPYFNKAHLETAHGLVETAKAKAGDTAPPLSPRTVQRRR